MILYFQLLLKSDVPPQHNYVLKGELSRVKIISLFYIKIKKKTSKKLKNDQLCWFAISEIQNIPEKGHVCKTLKRLKNLIWFPKTSICGVQKSNAELNAQVALTGRSCKTFHKKCMFLAIKLYIFGKDKHWRSHTWFAETWSRNATWY